MEYEIIRKDDKVLCVISGDIVQRYCDSFRDTMLEIIKEKVTHVCLKMQDVTFIDSVGLGCLMGIKMTCSKHKAQFMVLSPTDTVMGMLQLSRLDSVFNIRKGAEAEEIEREFSEEPDAL